MRRREITDSSLQRFALVWPSLWGLWLRNVALVSVHRVLKLRVFISEFVRFILGNDTAPETETTAQSEQHRLRRRLVERCDHISDEARRISA